MTWMCHDDIICFIWDLIVHPYPKLNDGLTHWGRVTHIYISNLTIIGSDNGLSPGRRQAIIWIYAGMPLIRTLGTNASEILSEIHTFSLMKMHLKLSSGKWRPLCFGLNVLTKLPLKLGYICFTWINYSSMPNALAAKESPGNFFPISMYNVGATNFIKIH